MKQKQNKKKTNEMKKKHKLINVWGGDVEKEGKYLCVESKLSMKSRSTLHKEQDEFGPDCLCFS